MRVWLPVMLAVGLGVACSTSGDTPSAPTVPEHTPQAPPPPPPTEPANVAGTWRGTMEAPGFAPRTIVVLAFQSTNCVDGAWRTEPGEWTGAISGYAGVGSFAGSVSFQRTADGPARCGGIADFSGEVGANTIKWTSNGFTGECPGGLPQSVTITLRRE